MRPEDQVKDAAPPPPPPPPPRAGTDVVREQDKLMLILSYLWLAALVPLLTVNDSEAVRWHAKNGLVLSMGGFLAAWIFGHIPFIGWFAWILDLVTLVLMVASIYRALEGVRMRIPVVSDVADKL
ncbi:MAG TPA: hypothetical protein VFA20_27595 [Myxococcaceae bacterium]|nr:hypothetical protein [Myxococcaceae bacterium]